MIDVSEIIPVRVACKNGVEIDAIDRPWYLKWADGERASIKRGMNRRHRRQVRQMIRSAY